MTLSAEVRGPYFKSCSFCPSFNIGYQNHVFCVYPPSENCQITIFLELCHKNMLCSNWQSSHHTYEENVFNLLVRHVKSFVPNAKYLKADDEVDVDQLADPFNGLQDESLFSRFHLPYVSENKEDEEANLRKIQKLLASLGLCAKVSTVLSLNMCGSGIIIILCGCYMSLES